MQWRARRSLLWTPGLRADRWTKGLQGSADLMVADLEDGVAPDDKDAAREAVAAALKESQPGKVERGVRINAWPTTLARSDIEAVAPLQPDIIAVPKVEEAAQIHSLEQLLDQLRCEAGLLLMFETARGIFRAHELTAASRRVVAVAFGAEDYAADVGARRSKESTEVLWARSRIVAAAALARVDAIDQVFVDIDDSNRLTDETRFAAQLGFRGKMLIHPKQVPVVHEAFRPTPDELSWARAVVAAAEGGGVGQGGVVVVERKMVDRPLIAQARRIVELAALYD